MSIATVILSFAAVFLRSLGRGLALKDHQRSTQAGSTSNGRFKVQSLSPKKVQDPARRLGVDRVIGSLLGRAHKADSGALLHSSLDDISIGKPRHQVTEHFSNLQQKITMLNDCSKTIASTLPVLHGFARILKCMALKNRPRVREEEHTLIDTYQYGDGGYWEWTGFLGMRNIDSVVLPKELKARVLQDLDWFTNPGTAKLYERRGIPYHRGYLFHGAPGTGKTSFISALTGKYRRKWCSTGKLVRGLGADDVSTAMRQLPPDAVLVFEDMDSMFKASVSAEEESDSDRRGSGNSFCFSVLLNMLDGPDLRKGALVFMTANHPEKLDPALTRPGRIDVSVPFEAVSDSEVCKRYFLLWYSGESEAAAKFADACVSRLDKNAAAIAQIQHFFLSCDRRRLGPQQAADDIRNFTFDGNKALDGSMKRPKSVTR